MLNDPRRTKPHTSYFDAIKIIGRKFNPSVTAFIHIDDNKENIDNARQVEDFKGIHFYLPNGPARESSTKDLEQAFYLCSEDLRNFGVL
jgi:hypothetical protein